MTTVKVCPHCGSQRVHVRHLSSYHYRESGLDDIWLRGKGVLEATCAECGERSVAIRKEQQLLQVIALGLLQRPGFLTGKEIRYLRETCSLTQAGLALALGHRRATIADWEREVGSRHDRGSEVYLRAILLARFKEVLGDPNRNHLPNTQRRNLESFERRFANLVEAFTAPRRPAKLSMQRTKRDAWRPVPPGLAAA